MGNAPPAPDSRETTMDLGSVAPRWAGLHLTHRTVDGTRLRVLGAEEAGSGTPHVLLHGLGASSLSWVEVAGEIARRGPVLAPDLTGFGLSEPPAGHRVTIDTALDGAVALLDDLAEDWDVDRVVLHGNSLGGYLAALLAARHPDRVAGLVLGSPAMPMRPHRALPLPPAVLMGIGSIAVPGLGEGLLAWAARKDQDPMMANDRMLEATFANPEQLASDAYAELYADEIEQFSAPWRRRALLSMTRSVLAAMARPWAWRELRRIHAPTVVLWGAQDRLLPPGMLHEIRHHRPDWDVRVVDGVAHVPQLDRPDAYLEAVDGVLVHALGPRTPQQAAG